MPPASFEFLVLSLATQAQMALGLFGAMEGEEKMERNLPMARHFIDLMVMLGEKTKGNLSLEEGRLLENSLTELRFRYVQAFEEEKKQSAQKQEESAAEAPVESSNPQEAGTDG